MTGLVYRNPCKLCAAASRAYCHGHHEATLAAADREREVSELRSQLAAAQAECESLREHIRDIETAKPGTQLATVQQQRDDFGEEIRRLDRVVVSWGDKLVTATNERDAALRERDEAISRADLEAAHHEHLRRERDAARAERERMRPVYEAAVNWFKAEHTGDANCSAGDHDDCPARPAKGLLRVRIAEAIGIEPDRYDMTDARRAIDAALAGNGGKP